MRSMKVNGAQVWTDGGVFPHSLAVSLKKIPHLATHKLKTPYTVFLEKFA